MPILRTGVHARIDGQLVHLERGAVLTDDEAAQISNPRCFEDPPQDDASPLDGHTVTELRAIAAAADVDLAGATRKADIVAALEAHAAAIAEG